METVYPNVASARLPAGPSAASGSDTLVDRLMQGAHEAVDVVGAKAGPALEKLTETATSARGSLEAKAGELAHLQGEMLDSARSYVRERPFTALAAAALLGALAVGLARSR